MSAIPILILMLGVWFLVSALANWDWYKAMVDFAAIEGLMGEDVARWACGLSGLVMIGGGIYMLAA
jgi:hypothetical protein